MRPHQPVSFENCSPTKHNHKGRADEFTQKLKHSLARCQHAVAMSMRHVKRNKSSNLRKLRSRKKTGWTAFVQPRVLDWARKVEINQPGTAADAREGPIQNAKFKM
jgi:hypothetical protein